MNCCFELVPGLQLDNPMDLTSQDLAHFSHYFHVYLIEVVLEMQSLNHLLQS